MTDYNKIYMQTIFSVKDDSGEIIDFTVAQIENFPSISKKVFAIITAFNPNNQNTPEGVNEASHMELKKDIEKLMLEHYETFGRLDKHSEKSFTIEGIDEKTAVALGRKYNQHAIVYNDQKGAKFIKCGT